MSIKVESVKGLDNKITFKKKPVPHSSHPNFPVPLFFTYVSYGMKNSGKSYSICKMLSLFDKYPVIDADGDEMINRVIWLAPTANFASNSIITTIESLDDEDIHENVNEGVLKEIFEKIVAEKELLKQKGDYIKAYEKFLKVKNVDNLKLEHLIILSEHNFEPPNKVFGHLKNYCYFLVLDDLIGASNSVFGMKKNNLLSNIIIKHRHYGINLIMTSQSQKYIPPIIRANTDIIQIFKTASSKVLNNLYEEVSNLLTEEEFEQLFNYCIAQPYGSLIINNHQQSKHRFWLNFEKILTINGKG